MKYNVGDKVRIKSIDWYNKNKDVDGDVLCGEFDFVEGMKKFCSETFTISDDDGDCYLMLEDNYGYAWTDEMIECKLEEECPQDFIEKYCKSCGTQRCDRTKEWLDGCPYYNTYMCEKQNNAMEEETKPIYEDEVNGEYYSTSKYLVRPSGYQFIDESGNVINATKIVLEKKKKEYPKTYKECCEVLDIDAHDLVLSIDYRSNKMKHNDWKRLGKLNALNQILICRDAYWKIAGEEIGLGKPWENGRCEAVYGICRDYDDIVKQDDCWGGAHIFEFPTREMRDAFYENFKELIEQCKELL